MRIFWFLVILAAHFHQCRGVWWTAGGPLVLQPRRICGKVHSLGGERQKNICRRDRQLLKEIVKGVEIGMDECQFQLRNHRWNCTTRRRSLGKMLLRGEFWHSKYRFSKYRFLVAMIATIGSAVIDYLGKHDTKEAAFVHSTTASGVAHVVAHACGKGKLKSCTCHQTRRYRATDGVWLWGGCGDNFEFGYQKSLEFMDLGNEPANDVRSKIMRHNNEVGRLAIKNHMTMKCKCHGLSASCELKTCWPKMPAFRTTGDTLLSKFKAAKPVAPDNTAIGSFLWIEEKGEHSKRRKVVGQKRLQSTAAPQDSAQSHLRRRSANREEELVYTDSSPNLCRTNRKLGILGTRGRICNGTTNSENSGSCEYLCCGRGFRMHFVRTEINCRCKFHWCCEVICDRCVHNQTSHYCS